MGRGKKLSESEIKTILKLKNENFSVAKIARILKRSRNVVMNLLKDPENYGKKKSPGRPSVLSDREKRAILRVASNAPLTARQIAQEAGVSTNILNVQRLLKKTPTIKRKKLTRKPPLTKNHVEERLKFAREHLKWKKRWRNIIFTDEKRFTLDGPDGWSYYFHDLRRSPLLQVRRQMGGGGVMVWAGIGYKGKTDICIVDGKMKSPDYIKLIDDQIRTHAARIAGENFVFQQDNAAVHTARIVTEYFASKNITTLRWPARSPDLNIIENAWGQLSRTVYRGSKQFNSIQELRDAIKEAWRLIPQKYIKKLYKSLPNRMICVVEKQGKSTHY